MNAGTERKLLKTVNLFANVLEGGLIGSADVLLLSPTFPNEGKMLIDVSTIVSLVSTETFRRRACNWIVNYHGQKR